MSMNYPEFAPRSNSLRFSRAVRGLLSGPLAVLREPIRLIALWRHRARARADLRMLCEVDPRTLQDIGLGADDVRREMYRPFWR